MINSKDEIPDKPDPVLAHLTAQGDLGLQQWYEVIYHDGEEWCSYSESKTFEIAGTRVINWIFAMEALHEK